MSQYSRQPTRSLAQVIETLGESFAALGEVHVSDLHTCGR
jgi:hypothetical protein